MPPVHEWDAWPFVGDFRPRPLEPPLASEKRRRGAGGVDCWACQTPDEGFLWTNPRWRVASLEKPSGLPVVVLLFPRDHFADPGDLPDELAAELGLLLAKVERAVRTVGEIGRVHVCRWGDNSEHLHWWFMGRPARLPQLTTSLVAIWDDVLPPLPHDVWRANLAAVRAALAG
jgi:diadenosine tetraphosphate (Ap4A) HIT family hydrolase